MLPYNARLWGVPPSEVTSEWCQRFVPLPKLEDVLRGALGAQAPELGYNTSFWYPERGVGTFSRRLPPARRWSCSARRSALTWRGAC